MIFNNPHRRIDRWIRSNPGRIDLFTGAFYTLMCTGVALAMGAGDGMGFALSLFAIAILQSAPLMVRRRYPWGVTIVVACAHLTQLFFQGFFLPSQLSVPLLIYTMAVYGKRWQSFATLGVGLLGAILATFNIFGPGSYGQATLSFDMIISFVGLSLVVTLAWTFGDLARSRRQTLNALRAHAQRLENERLIERELAASDERNHIAREMHDIVAHSLSVIITQADGARYAAAQDPNIAVETLKTVSDAGRSSLREMRRLLGVLRTDEEVDHRPLPTLENIPDLVETALRSGLEVYFQVKGSPRRQLPTGAELTAYRCVQEALTNVMKHAGPRSTTNVTLSWTNRGIEMSVIDDGRGAGSLGIAGTGQGLRGLHERVSLYDGTSTAAPHPGGGFAVSVFIPYSED
ncbi:sensor histidine kinase [Glutamicibacter sp. BW80]|uniref:sensor histidine kinase n=1 Tax=Glutamicibacter sp. BW80 TaxID=2024404 RepID=UPI0020D13A68|nr:sensor histidine kinase [Glutamicibacter sp. BW80]